MALFIFIVVPVGFVLLGKLLGLAVAASSFFSVSGNRLGKSVGRLCMPLLPAVYLGMLICGGEGDAGIGFRFFGSEALFGLSCALPIYGIPIFAVYAGGIYVIRDLTLGHDNEPRIKEPRTE